MSHRVLTGAALGSLVTIGAAAAPAAAATHGSTQGASPSDPDGMSNGGADKPGGSGGVNKADQDGNNGSGNDSDCEDDNNGVGTPGSCDAHARNSERAATHAQDNDTTTTGTSTGATARAHASGGAAAHRPPQAVQPAPGRAHDHAAARRAIAQIRAQLRSGTISEGQAEEQIAAVRAELQVQLTALRVAALEVTAAIQRQEALASSGVTSPAVMAPGVMAALPGTVSAPSTVAAGKSTQTSPAGQVLGTQFRHPQVSVAASRVPASARSATSFAGVTAPAAAATGMLPHTGAASGDLAGVLGLGAGAIAAGAALTVAARRRTSGDACAEV